VAGLASRLTGSSDLYQSDGRRPFASINFITAHDGFTMRDLVSYNDKHNEANLESNRDGTDDNRSWNCGVEGPTDDAQVLALRARQHRNFLTALLLSQGVPMLLGGDEMGRSQAGNNNAYCQDNEVSWFDWDLDGEQRALLDFTRRLIALRKAHPVFHRRDFFGGRDGDGSGLPDIRWFREDGREMSRRDWRAGERRVLGVFLNGEEIPSPSPTGDPVIDDSFVLLVNGGHEPSRFRLPARRFGNRWRQVVSTADPEAPEGANTWPGRAEVPLEARSILLLRRAW
jgi:isoamylase